MWRIKSIDDIISAAAVRPLRRCLGPLQLIFLGVGAIIGTGIFILIAEAAQKAGPAMLVSFAVAGLVCVFAALCYAELAAMIPVSGSAYTFTYASLGEIAAWLVGWALILEYTVTAAAVAVGWSGYFTGLLASIGVDLPNSLTTGPYLPGGLFNLPAFLLTIGITGLLMLGTSKSARFNFLLVAIKVGALSLFVWFSLPVVQPANFAPLVPNGWDGVGVAGASIFFAFVGFDAVTTAAEETKRPQRDMPIGLMGSLAVCTAFYILVATGTIGAVGAQPITDAHGAALQAGSTAFGERCVLLANAGTHPLVCSREALAFVLRALGHPWMGNLIGIAAFVALPSVVLIFIYGQTRIFFVMARDGLLPHRLCSVHPRWGTPHWLTLATGGAVAVIAALLPVGKLADISNSGTLFAFAMVAAAVMVMRRREPDRTRPFRVPFIGLVGTLAIFGTTSLYFFLPLDAKLVLPIWAVIGLMVYGLYGRRHSHIGRQQRSALDNAESLEAA